VEYTVFLYGRWKKANIQRVWKCIPGKEVFPKALSCWGIRNIQILKEFNNGR